MLAVEIVDVPAFESIDCCGFLLVVAGKARGSLVYQPEPGVERIAPGGTIIRVRWSDPRLEGIGPRRTRMTDYALTAARVRSALRRTDAAAPLALRSAALHIVATAIRTSHDTVSNWLNEAREVIEAHCCEGIRPADVATAVGVAPARLAKAFRREFGESVSEALRTARIEAAVEQLIDSDRSIADVARRCGFYDVSHFIRNLDAATGLRPAALRERR